MAESAAYTRRGFKGGAKPSTVPAGVSNVAVALTASDLSTWAGVTANGPFEFVLDPDSSNEEVCEATTLAGNVISGIARGLRGTSAVAHPPSCVIKHVASDRDFDEANLAVAKTVGKITGANSILISDAANSLAELAIPASRVIGRKAAGNIVALTQAETFALLGSGVPDATTFLRGDGTWTVVSTSGESDQVVLAVQVFT